MRKAKYLFEMEYFFKFYIYIYECSLISYHQCSCPNRYSRYRYLQYYQYSYPKYWSQHFWGEVFIKNYRTGKFIFSNLAIVISKNFSSMSPNHSGYPNSSMSPNLLHFHSNTHSRYIDQYKQRNSKYNTMFRFLCLPTF